MKILSPAGSLESVYSAVKFGADAIYLGLSDFSARKNAQNFSKEELREAVMHCRKRGVEVFAADGLFCCDADVVFEGELVVCLCFFIWIEA